MPKLRKPPTWRTKLSRVKGAAAVSIRRVKRARGQGVEVAQSYKSDSWRIEVTERGVSFARYSGDHCVEAYGTVDLPRASVYAAAIIQGFQPPRSLSHLDKPAG